MFIYLDQSNDSYTSFNLLLKLKDEKKLIYKVRAIGYKETDCNSVNLFAKKLFSKFIITKLAQNIASSIQVYKIGDNSSSMADGAVSISIEPGKPVQVNP